MSVVVLTINSQESHMLPSLIDHFNYTSLWGLYVAVTCFFIT